VPANLAVLRFRDSNKRFLQARGESSRCEVVLLDRTGQELQASVQLSWQSSCPQDFSVDAQGLLTALVDGRSTSQQVRVEVLAGSGSVQIN